MEFIRDRHHTPGHGHLLVGRYSSAVLRTWLSRPSCSSLLTPLSRAPHIPAPFYFSLQCRKVNSFILSLAWTPEGFKNTCAFGNKNAGPPSPPTSNTALLGPSGPRPKPLVEALTQWRSWRSSCPVVRQPSSSSTVFNRRNLSSWVFNSRGAPKKWWGGGR